MFCIYRSHVLPSRAVNDELFINFAYIDSHIAVAGPALLTYHFDTLQI